MSSNHIVYNLTVQVEKDIEHAWLAEIRHKIIPEVLDGEVILSIQLNRIYGPETEEGSNYALQFLFPSVDIFNSRKLERLSILITMMDASFAGKYVYFGTMMEVLHYSNK